ncbi:SIR2 family NAD-dependent protein deacylase [Paenibacillus kribbensis]|uniref:SIR2 family NAD-dependent protein deacylase n=1 Tax=Paenibacillus kribbensis TaxID=172713 RepID=UPI0008395290|nr:SIR2 family protein [Paenibacillus kribbensis]
MTDHNITHLRNIYSQGRLVPFIGAGLSIPFKIPSWGDLINELSTNVPAQLLPAIEFELSTKNYWNAVDSLMRYGRYDERQIQEGIVRLVQAKQVRCPSDEDHNYSDIGRLNFQRILTTNYDQWLYDYLEGERLFPQILSQSSVSSHELVLDESPKRIWHLHGNISDTGSLVLTRNKYNQVYSEEKYKRLFSLISGSFVLLFMGFSFDDEYIRQLIQDYNDTFQARHFILLDRPSEEIITDLKAKYRLEVISYDSTKSSHVKEIRRILNEISSTEPPSSLQTDEDEFFVEPPDPEIKEDLNKNLFCKKIKLERIDNETYEQSKDFFFFADRYIRKLRKKRFDERVIMTILTVCAMKYADIKKISYGSHFDSQLFIDEIHEQFGCLEYGRLTKVIQECLPFDFENKGLIHVLADDWEKDIWWGDNRISRDEYYAEQ